MKKQKIMLATLMITGFSALGIYKFNFSKKTESEIDSNVSPPEVVQTAQAAQPNQSEPKEKPKKQGYEIKEYKGNIAVFEEGEKKPFRVTDIEVKNLPETDQKELKNGIEAPDNDKLQTLLEDYLS